MAADEDIRFVTYLSPSIPQAFFEALADHVQRALGRERVSLRIESQASGPQKGGECSSFAEVADVAFMCAPSFVWLRNLRPPPAELLGVLPMFDDERNQGRPVYFCDVVVRNNAPIQAFSELEGASWAYNDSCSLSGYYSLLNKLAESGTDESFFDNVFCSGSHLNSIEAVLSGKADAAAIDSNVLRIRSARPPRRVARDRVLGSLPDTARRREFRPPSRAEKTPARCIPLHRTGPANAPNPGTLRPQPLRRRRPKRLFPRRPQRPRSTTRCQIVRQADTPNPDKRKPKAGAC